MIDATYKMKTRKLPKNGKITKPGVYYVDQDIIIDEFSDDQLQTGINISGLYEKDVVIDFQGHALKQSSNISHISYGLFVNGIRNIAIKNAVIEGFFYGIQVISSQNCTITSCVFKQSYYAAMRVSSDIALIENNQIKNLNFLGNNLNNDHYIIGIIVEGGVLVIDDNRITNHEINKDTIDNHLEYVGILVSANTKECHIENNFLTNEFIPMEQSYAVWAGKNSEFFFLIMNLLITDIILPALIFGSFMILQRQ